jgi:DNA-binding transcriptional regulator YiaG
MQHITNQFRPVNTGSATSRLQNNMRFMRDLAAAINQGDAHRTTPKTGERPLSMCNNGVLTRPQPTPKGALKNMDPMLELKNSVIALGINQSERLRENWERNQAALQSKMQAALDRRPELVPRSGQQHQLKAQLAKAGQALRAGNVGQP